MTVECSPLMDKDEDLETLKKNGTVWDTSMSVVVCSQMMGEAVVCHLDDELPIHSHLAPLPGSKTTETSNQRSGRNI